jgi:hypothetical protein
MSDISASEKKISQLSSSVGVTEKGKAWLDCATDPFKDLPVKCEGFPGLNAGSSVVRTVRQTLALTKPASIPVGAPWSALVFLDPFVNNHDVMDTSHPGAFVLSPIGQVNLKTIGGLTVRAGIDSVPLTITDTIMNSGLPAAYATPNSRVLGMGFEIHDATAVVEKQGTLTTWRLPTIPNKLEAYNNFVNPGVLTQRGGTNVVSDSVPPISIAEAMLLPYTRQWEAKDGVYSVSTMNSQVNNPVGSLFHARLSGDSKLAANRDWFTRLQIDAATNVIFPNQTLFETPFNMSGAFLTGLSDRSTFTLNVNYLVETFPTSQDIEIVNLATPSVPYDPAALELYSRIAVRLPPGVKVNQNAAGDWIKNIANLMGTFGVPGMPLVNAGVDLYNSYANSNVQTHDPGLINFGNSPFYNPRPMKQPKIQQQKQQQRKQQNQQQTQQPKNKQVAQKNNASQKK